MNSAEREQNKNPETATKNDTKPGTDDDGTTVIAESPWAGVLLCVTCGAVGGWVITLLADWLTTLRWAPLKGPAELLASIPEPGLTVGAIAVGAALGLLVGFIGVHESLTVRISRNRVTFNIRDCSGSFTHDRIGMAVRDDKDLVLLAPNGMEIAREQSGLRWQQVADTFTAHGYTWADTDPYRNDFRRWVPGASGLPAGADALLIARAAARKNDDHKDARELRHELLRLGVVVRDNGKRQYWRIPG
ncbi:hypothetical protein AB0O01_29315 [Streptomyces sp. NPDC093252]|uniref:YqeB family protein n=1 Tax=Streptomyces sp. NPDC093252 TaxID=3154980 RepID=UPI00343D41D0